MSGHPLSLSAVVLAALLVNATDAWSCSCRRNLSAENVIKADAVFVGVQTGMAKLKEGNARSTFKVIEGLKGTKSGSVLQVEHRTFGPSCGFGFSPRRVLVTAYKSDESSSYETSRCSLFSPDHELVDELRFLAGVKTVGSANDLGARIAAKRDRITCNGRADSEDKILACTRLLDLESERKRKVRYFLNRAGVFETKNDWLAAIKDYGEAMPFCREQREPKQSMLCFMLLHHLRAAAYERSGQTEDAKQDRERSAELQQRLSQEHKMAGTDWSSFFQYRLFDWGF